MKEPVKQRGRPRSEETKEGILLAAFHLLIERGYDGLSLDGVAKNSGTARTTIYRWWRSKAELAVEAFFHNTEEELRIPETGSAAADFRVQILQLAGLLRGPRGQAFAGMVGGARGDAALAQALGARWLTPRKKWGFERMTRAAKAGQLQDGVNIPAALAILYGPIYTPLLFGQPVPEAEALGEILKLSLRTIFRESGSS